MHSHHGKKYILLFSFLIISCSSPKTKLLQDNLTKVPIDSDYFIKSYRAKFLTTLPEGIDENSIYIEDYYLGFKKERFEIKDRVIHTFRFYKNGGLNNFNLPLGTQIADVSLNPEYFGFRGICFKKDGKWFLDLIAPVTEMRNIGIYKYEFVEIQKDIIKLKRVNDYYIYVYRRISLNEQNKLFDGDW